MIVVDASAMVEALIGFDPDPTLVDALTGEVAAPHLLDVGVMSALRRLTLGGKLDAHSAEQAAPNSGVSCAAETPPGPPQSRGPDTPSMAPTENGA